MLLCKLGVYTPNLQIATISVLENTVAVGMVVAHHPPRRSLRAELSHRAPTLDSDTKAR